MNDGCEDQGQDGFDVKVGDTVREVWSLRKLFPHPPAVHWMGPLGIYRSAEGALLLTVNT